MLAQIRPFRHAATIILASKLNPRNVPSHINDETSNLVVLAVKRTPKSSFMPSTMVFPGGALDEADFSPDFASAYKEVLLTTRGSSCLVNDDVWKSHVSSISSTTGSKPPAYTALRQSPLSSQVPPEWAFRICALRELFEECGILVGYSLHEQRYTTMDSKRNCLPEQKQEWESGQHRVRESAQQFAKFSIDQLGVVPAFWLLDEWANWLAPSAYKQRARFDGLFYLCCVDEAPEAVVFAGELEECEWSNPRVALENFATGINVLPPPQFYEFSRLANFSSLDELRTFSKTRSSRGLERMFPYLADSADGRRLTILPGDDQYPVDMDETRADIPILTFQETAAEMRLNCKNLHRGEFDCNDDTYRNGKLYISIEQTCGHVAPVGSVVPISKL